MSFTQTWFRFQYEFLYLESTQTGKYLLTSVSVWKVPIVVHFFDEMKHFFYIYHFLSIKEQSWDLQTNHHNCNMKVKVLTSSFIFLSTSNPKIPQKCRIGDNWPIIVWECVWIRELITEFFVFSNKLTMNHTSLRSSI